eukprot:GGOE01052994.1.p2 GENE.GGOE01052994.1~~GGOE01052994.1.p2  ORF type:complete len:145 (+),score=19.32 GGOE01052994.1:19-453(+)
MTMRATVRCLFPIMGCAACRVSPESPTWSPASSASSCMCSVPRIQVSCYLEDMTHDTPTPQGEGDVSEPGSGQLSTPTPGFPANACHCGSTPNGIPVIPNRRSSSCFAKGCTRRSSSAILLSMSRARNCPPASFGCGHSRPMFR